MLSVWITVLLISVILPMQKSCSAEIFSSSEDLEETFQLERKIVGILKEILALETDDGKRKAIER